MNSAMNRYATPFTVGLFVVSAVSGTALFFHAGQSVFHEMHEWLSMVLLLPFALHVRKNWPALVGYMRRGTLLAPVLASLVAGALFAAPALTSSRGEGNAGFKALHLMTLCHLTELAPVLHTTPEELQAKLLASGFKAASTSDSVASIAKTAGTEPEGIIASLISR